MSEYIIETPEDVYSHKVRELEARIKELESELLEQCRLNGMGAEREAKLIAGRDAQKARIGTLLHRNQQLTAAYNTLKNAMRGHSQTCDGLCAPDECVCPATK